MGDEITNRIYHLIRDKIIDHSIPAGVKINQNHLAETLGVSRTPVVKALHRLSSEGWVDNLHNRGFQVHQLSLQETADIFAVRQSMEMTAAAAVAEQASDADLLALQELFAPFSLQSPIDVSAYRQADIQFHNRMVALSGNRLLQRINDQGLLLSRSYVSGLLRAPEDTLAEHNAMIASLIARDGELARKLAYKHLNRSLQRLRETIADLRRMGIDPATIPAGRVQESNSACTS